MLKQVSADNTTKAEDKDSSDTCSHMSREERQNSPLPNTLMRRAFTVKRGVQPLIWDI